LISFQQQQTNQNSAEKRASRLLFLSRNIIMFLTNKFFIIT
jgi:hypothetical protein